MMSAMNVLTQVVIWLNRGANAAGRFLLAPIAHMPGWLSITCLSAILGAVCLVAFKYTSSQQAIRRTRDDIAAHLLAVKLFPDSLLVTLRCQARVLWGAFWLLVLAVVPMLVLIVPVSLVLWQMSLWYDARPLRVGEEAVVTVTLSRDADLTGPDVQLEPASAVEVVAGPVRIASKHEVCWNIRAREADCRHLVFQVGTQAGAPQRATKELVIGDGFMRTSVERPRWYWTDILWQPAEEPFRPDSPIEAIRIDYPPRDSWISGTKGWLIYCFAVSMGFGFCFRPWLKVDW